MIKTFAQIFNVMSVAFLSAVVGVIELLLGQMIEADWLFSRVRFRRTTMSVRGRLFKNSFVLLGGRISKILRIEL